MKMNASIIDVQSTGIISQSQAKIQDKNLGILFDIARKKIYTNKPLAIIREYCTNAYDAHVDAGIKDTPFEVSFPTAFKKTLTIRDFGKGLSEVDMYDIFFEYCNSNKRHTNELVGMLGLGSKSAFCYSDEYFITSYHNGVKSQYHAFIDDTRQGTIAKMHEEPTTETGLQIDVEIKSDDMHLFRSVAGEFLSEFTPHPIVRNDDYVVNSMQKTRERDIIIKNEHYSIHRDWRDANHVIRMGNVNYKFTLSDLGIASNDRTYSAFEHNYVKIYANIGDVTPSASREHLEMDDHTKTFIKNKFDMIIGEITNDAQNVLDGCKSFYQFVLEFEKMRQTIYSFKLKVQYKGRTFTANDAPVLNLSKDYPSVIQAEEYANYYRKKAFNKTTKIKPEEGQIFFTYAGDVPKSTFKQRILQSGHTLSKSFILSFKDTTDRDAFVNNPEWQGATFIDVATLPYVSAKKTAVYHSMVKSDIYRFVEGYTTKENSWQTESLTLANSSGVYVEMNRFIPRFRRPDFIETDTLESFNNILNCFHRIWVHVPVIYGVKTADIKKLGSGWISLEKYFENQIREMSEEQIEKINTLMISSEINSFWLDYFRNNVETSNDREELLKQIILKHTDKTSMTQVRSGHLNLLNHQGFKFNLSLYELTKTLIDETLEAHPILKLLSGKVCPIFNKSEYYQTISDYVMDR